MSGRHSLVEIARVYNTTAAMGYPARAEVQGRFRMSARTAQKHIKEAHQRGLIPMIQRQPHQKIINVADALDVTPAQLAAAIQRFAGGHLSIQNHSLVPETAGAV
ncbi:hypothetical protein [Nesterenkonia rhizosphaerae]|uniref:LexA repressor DNA-binding domain-containing protein n=1 Tax=Nesterenkonia rhizosphaerae TaxID=1348272 RepID=A0ABP9FWH5_9MICC